MDSIAFRLRFIILKVAEEEKSLVLSLNIYKIIVVKLYHNFPHSIAA